VLFVTSCGGGQEGVPQALRAGLSGQACDPGSLESLQSCAPAPGGNCHLCAAVPAGASGVCAQSCTVGNDAACGPGRACRPIEGLLRSGGYGRVGDCPDGYCR
jgi:hypothetical protein